MIRLFSVLCKHFNIKNAKNEVDTFHSYMKTLDEDALVCSLCGAKHSLSLFASYKRHLVTYHDGVVLDNMITISRYACSSCNRTHAILPSVIIPYMSFSFHFTVSLIYDYLMRTFHSIESLCAHYGIAVTTFYRIFKTFKEHKKLWLGLLEDAMQSELTFVMAIRMLSFLANEVFLQDFFSTTAVSFLQQNVNLGVT